MPKRTKIPPETRFTILLESGYKCANPVCRHVITLELHHIVWVKDDGDNEPENLLALCPNCHSLHTAGHIDSGAIVAWKSLLVAIGNPNRGLVDFLLVMNDETERLEQNAADRTRTELSFTGDSLPFLAPLITSRLIEIVDRRHSAGVFGGGRQYFVIALTDRGRHLVRAWRTGNPQAVREALTPPPKTEANHEDQAVRG